MVVNLCPLKVFKKKRKFAANVDKVLKIIFVNAKARPRDLSVLT
jgi:hypothetical protein